MMKKKDNLFKDGNFNDLPFSFNQEVAEVFEDMIDRSVPGYESSLRLIKNLSDYYFQPDTNCYDLGCSLGASSLSILKGIGKRKGQVIAVDNSHAMISESKIRFSNFIKSGKIKFLEEDINNIKINTASIVVINFVLQFLEVEKRETLLKRIFQGMKKGGILIISEKIHFDNTLKNQTIYRIYDRFKLKNGYSKMEISAKRDSLEGVLITDLEALHLQRLRKIGFKGVKKVMSNLNFITLIAER